MKWFNSSSLKKIQLQGIHSAARFAWDGLQKRVLLCSNRSSHLYHHLSSIYLYFIQLLFSLLFSLSLYNNNNINTKKKNLTLSLFTFMEWLLIDTPKKVQDYIDYEANLKQEILIETKDRIYRQRLRSYDATSRTRRVANNNTNEMRSSTFNKSPSSLSSNDDEYDELFE